MRTNIYSYLKLNVIKESRFIILNCVTCEYFAIPFDLSVTLSREFMRGQFVLGYVLVAIAAVEYRATGQDIAQEIERN